MLPIRPGGHGTPAHHLPTLLCYSPAETPPCSHPPPKMAKSTAPQPNQPPPSRGVLPRTANRAGPTRRSHFVGTTTSTGTGRRKRSRPRHRKAATTPTTQSPDYTCSIASIAAGQYRRKRSGGPFQTVARPVRVPRSRRLHPLAPLSLSSPLCPKRPTRHRRPCAPEPRVPSNRSSRLMARIARWPESLDGLECDLKKRLRRSGGCTLFILWG